MPDYIVTGKKGAGKTLAMVGRMRDYIQAGKPVATNVDLFLDKLLDKPPTAPVYRIADLPTIADLEAIGSVHETGDESKNGALFLDECSAFLNARTWNAKGRDEVVVWLAHARKRGWDCYFMVQSLTMLDKQVRESFGEYIVICRRLDRLNIPMFGRLIRLLTLGFVSGRFPQVHMAMVKYGNGPGAPYAETWTYRGRDLYKAYDTTQKIGHNDTACHRLEYRQEAPAPVRSIGPARQPKLRIIESIQRHVADPDERVRRVRQLAARGLV